MTFLSVKCEGGVLTFHLLSFRYKLKIIPHNFLSFLKHQKNIFSVINLKIIFQILPLHSFLLELTFFYKLQALINRENDEKGKFRCVLRSWVRYYGFDTLGCFSLEFHKCIQI